MWPLPYSQCDQMASLFFEFLAMCNNEHLPNCKDNLPN